MGVKADFDPARDDPRDEPVTAHHHFLGVKASEVGKIVNLRVNQSEQRSELRRPNEAPVSPHEIDQCLRGRHVDCLEDAFTLFEFANDGMTYHLAKEGLFVREVEVDGAFREPGALGDVLEPSGRETTLSELDECGVENLLRSLLRESTPARFGCGRRLWLSRHVESEATAAAQEQYRAAETSSYQSSAVDTDDDDDDELLSMTDDEEEEESETVSV